MGYWTSLNFNVIILVVSFKQNLNFKIQMLPWNSLYSFLNSISEENPTLAVPTAIFTGHSCNHFFGNNKAASNEATSQMHHSIYETTTASPLLDMRIREPWFSTIYNWRTRSADLVRSSWYYVCMSSTERPRTNINFTDIISAREVQIKTNNDK